MLQDKIAEIFMKVDDFCNLFNVELKKYQVLDNSETKKRNRKSGLCD